MSIRGFTPAAPLKHRKQDFPVGSKVAHPWVHTRGPIEAVW